jgi:hypothetical protein
VTPGARENRLPAALTFHADDGRYAIDVSQLSGTLYRVVERGYADDDAGSEAAALLEGLLDNVAAVAPEAKLYLLSDYTDYDGSSNKTRNAMLHRVVTRPSLGGVAFFGAGLLSRTATRLLNIALPRLPVRSFGSEPEALRWLVDVMEPAAAESRVAAPAVESAPASRLDSANLSALLICNEDRITRRLVGGVERRFVSPAPWIIDTPERGASYALLDDDVLLGTFRGSWDVEALDERFALEDAVCDELGLASVFLLYDMRGIAEITRPARQRIATFLSERRGRHLGAVVVSSAHQGAYPDLPALGHHREARDLDRAVEQVDRLREAIGLVHDDLEIPSDPIELEALARKQHLTLERHQRSMNRLLEHLGRISWDDTLLDG